MAQKLIKKILLFLILFIVLASPLNPKKAEAYYDLDTYVEVIVVCGDGYRDDMEACDPGNPSQGILPDLGTSSISCLDFGYLDGDLTCAADCSAITTNQCNTCGNAIKEGSEQCDTADYGGATCTSYGFNQGYLSCTPENPAQPGQSPPGCLLNLSHCYSVGLEDPGDVGDRIGGGGGGGGGAGGGNSGSPTGYNPGSDVPPQDTKVIIVGKGYPNSDIHILIDGKVTGIVRTNSQADFNYETTAIPPGVVSVGMWTEDKTGLKSTLLTLTLRVITGAITTITGAYLSPTIELEKTSIKKGESLRVFGQTVPSANVEVNVNSESLVVQTASSAPDGTWTLNINSDPLSGEEFHLAKALFQTQVAGGVVKSGFSRSVSFFVGEGNKTVSGGSGDLNTDKRVNLTDFSILLFNWGKSTGAADINKDGKINLSDFSIMMFQWTG